MLSPKPYIHSRARTAKAPDGPAPESTRLESPGSTRKEALTDSLHRDTYKRLRWGMMTIAILLPIVLWVSGNYFGIGMQASMSAFYHTAMRDVFVGVVFALGVCLYVYEGYNDLENTCLTLAGLCLFGVAWAPTTAPEGSGAWTAPELHYACAIAFFSLIAIVCIFAREHGLKETNGSQYDLDYRTTYNITACLMVLVLAVAVVLFLLNQFAGITFPTSTFWVEAAAIWVFAWYWGVKSRELSGLE